MAYDEICFLNVCFDGWFIIKDLQLNLVQKTMSFAVLDSTQNHSYIIF